MPAPRILSLQAAEGTQALLGMAVAVNWLRDAFIAAAKKHKVWDREKLLTPAVRPCAKRARTVSPSIAPSATSA
jgi:hypothetical protein